MFLLLLVSCDGCGRWGHDDSAPSTRETGDTHTGGTDTHDSPHETSETGESGETGETGDPPDTPWNVVVILSDDQRYDSLWAMPEVSARFLPQAVDFERAYVTIPMCCPMRSSFLSGGWYPTQTGVLTNGEPNGGASMFPDVDTLATRLQMAGVQTGLFGKYLNDYEYTLAPNVPPGWSTFLVTATGDGAYGQTLVSGNSGPNVSTVGTFTDTGGEYLTTFIFQKALEFADEHADEPYFLFIAPNSPHVSGNPATEDLGLYTDWSPRPTSWNEEDVSDKPAWVQEEGPLTEEAIAATDEVARLMYRNLASLDRETANFVDALEERGVLDHTLVIYTSDNGYLYGEHRLIQKGLPYEESVRVPLLVRAPGVVPREDQRLVAVNLDLAATVLDNFRLPRTGEGDSLLPALPDETLPLREYIFLDNYTTEVPIWAGLVTDRFKYVELGTGETELYDLDADPYEMQSLDDSPPDGAQLAAWHTLVDERRGLAITNAEVPPAHVGVPFSAQLTSWGGTPPVVFSYAGSLPDGLTLSADGLLSGTPTTAGDYLVGVAATDASVSPLTGEPQRYEEAVTISVSAGAAAVPTQAVVARWISAEKAEFVVRARAGATVEVRATADRAGEGRRVLATGVSDGSVKLVLDGLTANRQWAWVARVDGRVFAEGDVPVE